MSRRATMMPMVGGGGRFRPLLALTGIVGLVLVLRDPVGAAAMVEQVVAWGATAIDRLAQFGSALSR